MDQPVCDARRGGVSLDALVLILVTGFRLHLNSYKTPFTTPTLNAITVGLLGLYLAIDVLGAPLVNRSHALRRVYFGGKGAVLVGILALMVIWPTINLIGQRHATHPWLSVHDTSINVEEATKFLIAGKDPYAQTYFNTPLARFPWDIDHRYNTPNPALWWTDTFPGQELVTVPFLVAAQATLGWFDERFIYLLALAITVVLLLRLAPTPSTRLALVTGVALNPLWIPEFIYGQNDILVLAEIVVVLFLSVRERWRLALLALAIGCATKQTTLLLVPFYLWWLALRLGPTWRVRLERLALLLPWLAVPFILMVGPFAVWNWTAFYGGNFGYISGTVPHSYPIQGYDGWGAASFVLWSGLVSGPNAYFPFWAWEAGAALALAVLLLRRMRPDTPATVMLGAYATVLFPIFYLSRFFNTSYVAFTISLLLVAYLAHRPVRRAADNGHLSFDVIVVLLLVPQLSGQPTGRTNGILVSLALGLVLAYVVVATLAPWRRLHSSGARRLAVLARALVLAGIAETTVVSRSIGGINKRLHWVAPSLYVHDTALQTQISAGNLLAGDNPYTASFWNTPLKDLYVAPGTPLAQVRPDLPLLHNPHLPLGFLLGVPFQVLFNALHLLFDECYIYLAALLVAAALLPLLVRPPGRQLALLATVVLSPLFAMAVIVGQDDVLVLVALVAALLLLQRGRLLAASFAIGVAVAFKITAWPLVPLFLAYLAGLERTLPYTWPRRLAHVLARAWGLIPPLLFSALPFMLWNAHAFVQDTLAYPLGLMRHAVPLDMPWSGYQTLGFGRVAFGFGWVPANGTGYIGVWLAALLGVLVLALLVARLWRAPSLPLLLAGYLVLLFTLEYFGRFMVDTSLGYLAVLAPLSFFLPLPRPALRIIPLPVPATEQLVASG